MRGPAAASSVLNSEKAAGGGLLGSTNRVVKTKKDDKEKKDKGENAEGQEAWWPQFSFDGRHAMKSKLVLNLRNCQYDLFKTIAIEELGWRVIDKFCNVCDPLPPSEIKQQEETKEDGQEDDERSSGENSAAN